jgi:hypothetical protein
MSKPHMQLTEDDFEAQFSGLRGQPQLPDENARARQKRETKRPFYPCPDGDLQSRCASQLQQSARPFRNALPLWIENGRQRLNLAAPA